MSAKIPVANHVNGDGDEEIDTEFEAWVHNRQDEAAWNALEQLKILGGLPEWM